MSTRRKFVGYAVAVIAATVTLSQNGSLLANNDSTEHRIEIANFVFEVKVQRVKPGDKIIWVNMDIVPHTATAIDSSWNTGLIKPGDSATIEVSANMMESYFCEYHPMMVAELSLID